jgi:hypothetical protein
MRESRTYGSVRGARGNSRPYREVGVVYLQFAASAHDRNWQTRSSLPLQIRSADWVAPDALDRLLKELMTRCGSESCIATKEYRENC